MAPAEPGLAGGVGLVGAARRTRAAPRAPKSSSDSQMCSWRLRPACEHEDDLVDAGLPRSGGTRSRTWSGVPIAPRSEPSPCCMTFTPSGASSARDDRAREADLARGARGTRRRCRCSPGGGRRRRSSARASSRRSARRRCRARSPSPRRGGHHRQRRRRRCGLTAKPAGTQRSEARIASYSSTHSFASSGSTNEKRQRADAAARRRAGSSRGASRRPTAAGAASARGLGIDVARRHRDEAPVDAGERLLDHHPRDDVERLGPLLALGRAVDAEAVELGAARGLPRAELDAPAGDEVEHRDRLGHARGMLVARRQRQDPEARGGCARVRCEAAAEEDVGRADECEYSSRKWCSTSQTTSKPTPVGELDLLERVVRAAGARSPRPTGAGAGARRRSRSASAGRLWDEGRGPAERRSLSVPAPVPSRDRADGTAPLAASARRPPPGRGPSVARR